MTVRIITDYELGETFSEKLVLLDMGEPNLYAIQRDPSFLLSRVPHEYVCFDARRGEVIRLDDAALHSLKGMAS